MRTPGLTLDRVRARVMARGPRSRALYTGARQTLALPSYVRRRSAMRSMNGASKFDVEVDRGHKIISPGDAPEAQAVVARIDETVAGLDLGHMEFPNKPYVHTGLLDMDTLEAGDPLIRFALNPDLLASISRYLGVVPVLHQIGVWCSRYHPSAARGSQLFHCDAKATSQVKVFVYATAVGAGDGPLTVVDAAASTTAMKKLDYKFRSRVSDPDMLAAVRPEEIHPLVGPRGTVALVDTSRCFHMGSRLTEDSALRVLALFQYVGPVAFDSSSRAELPFSRFVGDETSRIERLVLQGG